MRSRFAGPLGVFLFALALCSPASANPVHLPLPGMGLSGFNHACGAAVDSEGDIYVSSAGESKVKVFDSSHSELTSIPNAGEPCGLAVDSQGNLYVSERATGEVVKYVPNAYPFSGAPVYGAPITIDSSGTAAGISVDPTDNRLYVAEGDHVSVYTSTGALETAVGGGTLIDATGVAAYTYDTYDGKTEDHYLLVADGSTNTIRVFRGAAATSLALGLTIDGSDKDSLKIDKTPDNGIGFGVAGASLSVNQANGHVLVYDAEHEVVDEFEASGAYLTQISSPGPPSAFEDAEPTAIAVYPELDENQLLQTNAEAGTFTLAFEGETTSPIVGGTGILAGSIRSALEELPSVGVGNVLVQESVGGAPNHNFLITFIRALSKQNVGEIECDGAGLTGGTANCGVTTERGGSGPDGTVYVTSGASSGAKLLAFAALTPPSRPPLPKPLSFTLSNSCGVAVDRTGDRYVTAGQAVYVYPPTGETPLAEIPTGGDLCASPSAISVDSVGNIYTVLNKNSGEGGANERAVYYTPASFPPKAGTKYSGSTTIATRSSFSGGTPLKTVTVNPANNHVFVSTAGEMIELESAKGGSAILDPHFGSGVNIPGVMEAIAVYGTNGDVYVGSDVGTGRGISILDPTGTKRLAFITGAGSAGGWFRAGGGVALAVDQATGNVLVFDDKRGTAEEYEASGAFVAKFGSFTAAPARVFGIAIDNSGGSTNGNVYVAYDDPTPGTFDLTALGPLAYGEPPIAVTGQATGVGGGEATLKGSVDPRSFELEACRFEYTSNADFNAHGFTGPEAKFVLCVPGVAEIGSGTGAIAVHADPINLDPEGRYRYRLVAKNKYGQSIGGVGLFGPPLLTIEPPLPVGYTEAALRATVDPSGLATTYRFQYGTTEAYGQSTPATEVPAGADPAEIEVPIGGLAEGTEYHFRIVVENESKVVEGPDQSFETLERPAGQICANEEFRTGHSANLPDCRAYELVTPAETSGGIPNAAGPGAGHMFSNWLTPPRGGGAGNSLSYFVEGTLPGFDGNGVFDGYRARRGSGSHPGGGWTSELFSPSYAETRGVQPDQGGIASDQEYSFWRTSSGSSLSTPAGFEPLGEGALALAGDPNAVGRYVAAGGDHAFFSSKEHLEAETPSAGTEAIYDRTPVGTKVVSLEPDGTAFGAGEGASYAGATEDGSAIAFKVGGALYLRRAGQTTEVAAAPNSFAGVSDDGKRVFYVGAAVGGTTPTPAGLYVCDVTAGPCALAAVEIAPDSRFVNVSPDGSRVYFTSTEVLDEGLEGMLGADNLYLWDVASQTIHFVARLDSRDLENEGFEDVNSNLIQWLNAVAANPGFDISPSRRTPDGSVLVFQSHAKLTSYDNEGITEVYRYDVAANSGTGGINCISCDPTDAPPSTGATLQRLRSDGPTRPSTLMANVAENGSSVVFESEERLLPEDANSVTDVYEWMAQGASGCTRKGGCLALISSGQGDKGSFLYSMSADGHDIFFSTREKLVGQDVPGSPSIYDARVDGGIPDPPAEAPCQGDACQGQGSSPPALPSPSSAGFSGDGNVVTKVKSCTKGKRKVGRKGKVDCVKQHANRRHHKKSGHHDPGAHR